MIEWVVITIVASAALVSAARIFSKPATIKAYKEAGKVKDDMIEDLRFRVRSLKGRIAQADVAPTDIESAGDIANIVRHLPRPLRPFAKPIVEWANTDEGKESIGKIISKWTKDKGKGPDSREDQL